MRPGQRPRCARGVSRQGSVQIGRASTTYVVSAAQRLTQLRQHGGFTLAYSAASQDNLEYFGSERGYIAYRMVGTTAHALADPIAAPEDRERLICEFIAAKSDVCFCQVSRPTAEILSAPASA